MQRTDEVVFATTSDAGVAIDRSMRTLMERLFGTDLGHVRLHCSAETLKANRALGSVAFTVGRHIGLRPGFVDDSGPAFPYILAHELAHVIQKERGRNHAQLGKAVAPWELEAEADLVACRIVSGRPASPVLADLSAEPRCWGPAGHYWTIYSMSMLAGLSKQDAMDNAFYAQMPDQVDELDATQEGYAFFWNYPRVFAGDDGADRVLRTRAVQMGLHALSGWNAEYETRYRTNILKTLKPGSFEFALALHPFGDSFAHRIVNGGERMYYGPLGHAKEINPRDCRDAIQKGSVGAACTESAHAVDNLNRRQNLYPVYGLALYDLLLQTWGTRPVTPRDKVEDYLHEVMAKSDEQAQIMELAALTAGETDQVHGDYDPNLEDCVCWKKFHSAHPWLKPDLLDRALWLAAQWSGSY